MTQLILRQRQVHLDFHTSPHIPDVATEFDAAAFARTFQDAHVDSVTLFAKCHHGLCYYPTKTGTQHPALAAQGGRDLLGEQIEALHRVGIRCPLYTTVAWEEDVAQRFPEWRQMKQDGTFAQVENSTDEKTRQPGGWKFNDFVHPDYQDYMEAHVAELMERYGTDVDGLFFDIVFFHPNAIWSEASVAFKAKHGLTSTGADAHEMFEAAAQASFAERFTRQIGARLPEVTVFYNSASYADIQPPERAVGLRARQPFQTHFELESLPSGFWGYQHFGRMARQVMAWADVPWLGMTGRFQKQWGDFGGIKPQAALEFECFRSQALGGANSVGDQLPPRGTLDAAAYTLIGAVYAQCEAAEPFYAGSSPLPQAGVLLPGYPGLDRAATDKSLEGAVLLCEEAHYEAVVLDDLSDFDGLPLLLLPDTTVITALLKQKLADYYNAGGRLLLSYKSGFDADGNWALDFLPLTFLGETDKRETEKWPTFWRARPEFDPALAVSDRVFYGRGLNVTGGVGTKTLVERVLPYFQRTDAHFCSHFQTPPVAEACPYPAVIGGERFVYFADPVFGEYRQTGNLAARDGWRQAMERLAGPASFGSGLPTTVLCVPRRRGSDLILTLLHYVPVRKALDIDVIEERMSFAGEVLRLPQTAESVRVFSGEALTHAADGGWLLPAVKGRLLLEAPGYFGTGKTEG